RASAPARPGSPPAPAAPARPPRAAPPAARSRSPPAPAARGARTPPPPGRKARSTPEIDARRPSAQARPHHGVAEDLPELVAAAGQPTPVEAHVPAVHARGVRLAEAAHVAARAAVAPQRRIAVQLADLRGVEQPAHPAAVVRDPGGVAVGGADHVGHRGLGILPGGAARGRVLPADEAPPARAVDA